MTLKSVLSGLTASCLVAGLTSSSLLAQCEFTITGTAAATNSGVYFVFSPAGSYTCGNYFAANGNYNWCTQQITCSTGDSAAAFATAIAARINNPVGNGTCAGNPGYMATVSGSTVTVTGPGAFQCVLWDTQEQLGCGGTTNSVLVDGCDLNNLCNGVSCDTFGPQVSGFQFGGNNRVKKYCNPADGNPNNTATIDIDGNTLSNPPINVCMSNGPPGQFGYLLIGNNSGIVNQPPGAKGAICVTGGSCLGRYAQDVGVIDSGGNLCTDIFINISNNGVAYGIPTCGGTIQPGQTWYFQYWHRQPQGQMATFSEALCVVFKQ